MSITINPAHFLYALGTSLLTIAALSGGGYALFRILGQKVRGPKDLFPLCWMGLFPLTSVIYLVNLFVPVNWITSAVLYALLIPFALFVRELFQARGRRSEIARFFAVLAAVTVIVQVFVMTYLLEDSISDLSGYHYHTVRLMNTFKAIKGVFNLHHRLGNNYAFFNLSALVSFFPFGYRAAMHNIPLQVIASVFSCQMLFLLSSSLRRESGSTGLFPLAALVVFWGTRWTPETHGYATDIVPGALGMVLLYYFWRFLEKKEDNSALVILFLAAGAVPFKMSLAFFALPLLVIVLFLQHRQVGILTMTKPLLLAVLLFCPFVANNVIKSGTLLFPLPLTDLGLPWGNAALVNESRISVTGWARQPGPDFRESLQGNWNWFPGWVGRKRRYLIAMGAVYLGSLLAAVVLRRWKRLFSDRRDRIGAGRNGVLLLIPVALGWVGWFFLMPDFRFSHALFWYPPMLLIGFVTRDLPERLLKVCLVAALGTCLGGVAFLGRAGIADVADPLSFELRYRPLRKVELVAYKTRYSTLYTPVNREVDTNVWDPDLHPATGWPNDNIKVTDEMITTEAEKEVP